MNKPARVLAALVCAATVAAGATASATAEAAGSASETAPRYVKVRSLLPADAQRFALASPDVRHNGAIRAAGYADTLGCTAANKQIRLAWWGAPSSTRSFAVTMQDVDAPTGSGFWHWLVWDVPRTSTALGVRLPAGAVVGTNDAGQARYVGPCPPEGDIRHRYELTVYALDVESLQMPAETTPAFAAFTIGLHVVGYGQLVGTARR